MSAHACLLILGPRNAKWKRQIHPEGEVIEMNEPG